MFYKCKVFNQPLNNWDVRQIESFYCMFYGCLNFNQDINGWKPHSAKSLKYFLWNTKIKETDIEQLLSSTLDNVYKQDITNL